MAATPWPAAKEEKDKKEENEELVIKTIELNRTTEAKDLKYGAERKKHLLFEEVKISLFLFLTNFPILFLLLLFSSSVFSNSSLSFSCFGRLYFLQDVVL